jgi:small nuclear ribonucleoprotein (snRNP)-like protein
MDWKLWMGKKVYITLRNGRIYSGKVIDVDEKLVDLTFLFIKDKFDKVVGCVTSEIIQIKEEEDYGKH